MQTIIQGDCLEEMRKMADNSIDFIVTDPPYGLHFMGKEWDRRIPAIEIWAEALRICKPGAMLAVFGGSRTHHHLMCVIEGAGWEIRDVIMWLQGQGFPKSLDISKTIDKSKGLQREIIGRKEGERYKYEFKSDFNSENEKSRLGSGDAGTLTKPNSDLANIFNGYGTALKPAYEPIILAMKPLDGTFAHNAEKWGVAGLNIDESRIDGNKRDPGFVNGRPSSCFQNGDSGKCDLKGRWPANLILDEEAAQQLDNQVIKNNMRCVKASGKSTVGDRSGNIYKGFSSPDKGERCDFGDSGGASRFFYCAKASSSERNRGLEGMPLKENDFLHGGLNNPKFPDQNRFPKQNYHPTVKPIALMKYILKLLAPPGNPICLDPFAGSGSTLVAAKELGINCIGIEKEAEYCEIARKRVNNNLKYLL